MASACLQLSGFFISFFGWIGIIIATATNDWIVTCSYEVTTCKKMDQLGIKGLWQHCVMSTDLYHCKALSDILSLPAYVQTSRALMISASIIGLPAVLLVLMSLPCINLGSEPESVKHRRSVIGGILNLLIALFGIISTVWFPIGAYRDSGLMTFGFSLYAGWIGSALCLFGGSMITCCTGESPQYSEDRFYYSKKGAPATSSPNHAKSAHV
ncbi:claudin-11b [Erpetoichthys calabaricus]|uniref:Claudin n=1 Tax=Erpetoichthys calabaricus TaxID=27687 RepID=A0A8C4S266_ERPCA|nr:claudin-11b [Erpetoichthys calabaricus]